jgi:hypothetical protein
VTTKSVREAFEAKLNDPEIIASVLGSDSQEEIEIMNLLADEVMKEQREEDSGLSGIGLGFGIGLQLG